MDMYRGTLQDFDGGTYTATVQIQGSRLQWLAGVPVNRGIPAGEMVAGRTVAVVFFAASDPNDAMVVGVY